MNKIKTKKQCKSMDNESPYNETEMSPLTKDIRCLKLLELKVVLQKNSYIDAMKFSTSDFITEEYEEDDQEDDFSNTRDRKKGIVFEPYKSDLISSNIESYKRKKFKNTKCKNFVVLNGSVEASTGKLQVQSKNLQRRQNLSEQSNKVLKEELITNVRKIQQYSINRRKESLLLSEDSAKDELHKTENKKVSLRNSSPAVKSSGTQQIAEKEKSKQARRKSTKIELEPEEEDDPNKLWCICRQPHNNRFMIMCDYCDDWFHGNCVGISKQKGRQLEELQQEWICPKCEKKGRGMYVNFFSKLHEKTLVKKSSI